MHSRRGFTLIELLVVIAIIGLLITTATAGLALIKQRARDSQRGSNISDLRKSLDLYLNQVGSYPVQASAACLTGSDTVSTALVTQKVLTKAVSDPVWPADVTKCYLYSTNGAGTTYSIDYYMETSSVQSQGTHTVTN